MPTNAITERRPGAVFALLGNPFECQLHRMHRCVVGYNMVDDRCVAGSARLVMERGVGFLDPAAAVSEAMLRGWSVQQQARGVKTATISKRAGLVRRLIEFSNLHPWQWNAAELEAFFAGLRSGGRPVAVSTVRQYQTDLRLFCASPRTAATAGRRSAWSGSVRHRYSYCTSGTRSCT